MLLRFTSLNPLLIAVRLFSSFWFRGAVLFLAGLVLVLGLAYWKHSPVSSQSTPALLPPLPQDSTIQVYFNHSQSATYTDPYRHQSRLGDNLEQVVIEAISAAQTSIDVAVHELNLPQVAQALTAKHQAGVKVRVIMEDTYTRSLSQLSAGDVGGLNDRERRKYSEYVQLVDSNQDGTLSAAEVAQNDAFMLLQAAKVPLIDDTANGSKGSDLMHHKFIVIDGQTLIVGSANLTLSDVHGDFANLQSQGNANHLLKITSPALAQIFTQEFNLMWGDGVGGKTNSLFGVQKPYRSPQKITLAADSSLTVQFSPTSTRLPWEQSVNGLIGRNLSRATHSVDLMLFVFSDQKLSNVLETDHRKGVQVRALIDPGFAYRDYSEALDMMGVALAGQKCRYETDNHPWTQALTTVGIPELPEGDLLHHKVGIMDGQTVITGSQNWSDAANEGNDENLLVIENATVAAHFKREFDRLYQDASLGVPVRIQEKIRQQHCQV